MKASTSSTSLAAPAVNVHEAFFPAARRPVVGNVAALVPHKGQRYLIEAAHQVVQRSRRALRDPRRRRLREHLEKAGHEHISRSTCCLPGFRTDVLGCIKGFDCSR
jgi:phosphopantothenate synthetase